jgi:hypothetical protein
MGRNEQPREDVVVGENQEIGDAAELCDLPGVLERTAALAQKDEVGVTREGVEYWLEGASEAGGEVNEDRVARRVRGERGDWSGSLFTRFRASAQNECRGDDGVNRRIPSP